MMPQPGQPVVAPAGQLEASALEAAVVGWERIQLHLRLRSTAPGADPMDGELFLRPRGLARPALTARGVAEPSAAGERRARFNVFCGHDQMPLRPGAWELVLRRPGHDPEWSAVPASGEVDGDDVSHDFPWYEVTYRVRLVAAPRPEPLTLAIDVDDRRWGGRRLSLAALLARIRDLRRQLWVGLFNALVGGIGRLPRHEPLVVFTSDSRVGLGGNLQLVHDRMRERGLDRRIRIRTIFKASIRMRRGLLDRARLVWLLARAQVILVEDYQPAIYRLPQRANQRIIQLWHAWGAFKTVGYSRIGKPGGPNPWSRVHKNYTFATVSSVDEVPIYAEAFGLPDERVVPTGTPRMDDFLDPARQAARRSAMLELLPDARDRTVILFAPTIRGRSARTAEYPVELVDVGGLHALCEERDGFAILKMHPFVEARVEVPEAMRDRIVDASDLAVDANDLLLITDLLVTDYSSLVFEFSALGRPMLFLAHDLEEYVASRDFYEAYESFVPGKIVRTFGELLDAIRREDFEHEKVAPFARRHLPERPGSATDRIIDELILGGHR